MSGTGNIVVMLIYEPSSPDCAPIPVVRVNDQSLTEAVAHAAVCDAESRAREILRFDEVLGKIEEIEALRLRRLLKITGARFRFRIGAGAEELRKLAAYISFSPQARVTVRALPPSPYTG
jgi:hypothetical protein